MDGAENVTLSGKFLSKVYEGSLRETEKWCRDLWVMRKAEGLQSGNGIFGMLPILDVPEK